MGEMKTKRQSTKNQKHPDLGDPMTQMYFDMVKSIGSIAAEFPDELNEDRMWQVIRKMDAIFLHHMRELIEEAGQLDLTEPQLEYHPAAQFIMDRLIRENQK